MEQNVKLIKYDIYEENEIIYLCLIYEITEQDRKYRLYLPKIATGFDIKNKPIIDEGIMCHYPATVKAPYSDNEYFLKDTKFDQDIPTVKGIVHVNQPLCYLITTIEEYPLEVTIEEIEKKFGHKIKIVKEKNNDAK